MNGKSIRITALFYPTIFLLITLSAIGQEAAIVTDRPDQTESAFVTGKRVLQVETGVVFSRQEIEYFSSEGFIHMYDYGTTLLRYGLSDRFELRLASAFSSIDYPSPSSTDVHGLQPIMIGAKVVLSEEKKFWPQVAIIGHLTLPWIGDKNLSPDNVAPDFRFSFAHTLSDRLSLGYNLGIVWDGNDNKSFIYTVSLGASVVGPLSMFAEIYGEEALSSDFGLTFLITPSIQLDASYGFGLSDESSNTSFINGGLSVRLGGSNGK